MDESDLNNLHYQLPNNEDNQSGSPARRLRTYLATFVRFFAERKRQMLPSK
jgi:hypothetical protein